MGICSSGVKIPDTFLGPYIFTGDSDGIMRQHAFKNNKIKLIRKYAKVHNKQAGGIKVMAMSIHDELITTIDNSGIINTWATQRKLRIFIKKFVEIKLTTAITFTTDNKFAFLANKFGKINQWDNVKKGIFNIWHFTTPGRAIVSLFCSKINNEQHQVPEFYDHLLNVATDKGEILQFSIPNATTTDHELVHTFQDDQVSDGKGTIEEHSIVDIHGTIDGCGLYSANKLGHFKQWCLKGRKLMKDFGVLLKVKSSNAMNITPDASHAIFALKKSIVVYDIKKSVFVGSYSISEDEIKTLVVSRVLYSEEEKCNLPHGKWKAMINKIDDDCDDKIDVQPGEKEKNNWFSDTTGSFLNLASSIASPSYSPSSQVKMGFYEIEIN